MVKICLFIRSKLTSFFNSTILDTLYSLKLHLPTTTTASKKLTLITVLHPDYQTYVTIPIHNGKKKLKEKKKKGFTKVIVKNITLVILNTIEHDCKDQTLTPGKKLPQEKRGKTN